MSPGAFSAGKIREVCLTRLLPIFYRLEIAAALLLLLSFKNFVVQTVGPTGGVDGSSLHLSQERTR
jgi:hypothetical protein